MEQPLPLTGPGPDAAVIVLGGEAPEPALLKRLAAGARWLVGADRGAGILLAAGLTPDVAVGDMDSIAPQALAKLIRMGVPLEKTSPVKDETDGQLALDWALAQGAGRCLLLAADGNRPDHGLANYQLLRRAAQRGAQAGLFAQWGCALAGREGLTWPGWPGRTVSLLPLSDDVVVLGTRGLAYEIRGPKPLRPDETLGVSNVMTGDAAQVELASGIILVFLLNEPC